MNTEDPLKLLDTLLLGKGASNIDITNLPVLLLALLASLLSSLALSWAYSVFYGPRFSGSNVHRSLPLISMATTAIFICVQFSLPLSLGLLGALSIVRFRTPIREPEEIGFIMLAVASSLCCATYHLIFLLLLLAVALLALVILHKRPSFLIPREGSGTLVIRSQQPPHGELMISLNTLLAEHLEKPALNSITSHDNAHILTWSFRKVTANGSVELQQLLTQQLPGASVGIYFNAGVNG